MRVHAALEPPSLGACVRAAADSEGESAALRPRDDEALWMHASKRLYGGAQYWRALQVRLREKPFAY